MKTAFLFLAVAFTGFSVKAHAATSDCSKFNLREVPAGFQCQDASSGATWQLMARNVDNLEEQKKYGDMPHVRETWRDLSANLDVGSTGYVASRDAYDTVTPICIDVYGEGWHLPSAHAKDVVCSAVDDRICKPAANPTSELGLLNRDGIRNILSQVDYWFWVTTPYTPNIYFAPRFQDSSIYRQGIYYINNTNAFNYDDAVYYGKTFCVRPVAADSN